MYITRIRLLTLMCVVLTALPSLGQGALDPVSRERFLFISHADIDPVSGDVFIISNSWRETQSYLRRFEADGTAVSDFTVERFETCCAINPSLVAVANDGSIFTLEFADSLGGFFIYKHAPNGELDIDWGEREGVVEEITSIEESDYAGGALDENGGGFEAGETTLLQNAGGGRFHYSFSDPIDIIPREDGSLLVLDRIDRYVDLISPDGSTISEFIGQYGYIPIRPQRMLMDSEGYIYIIDYYDDFDLNRGGMLGVFRFDPDGEWEFGWGEGINGINDPWRPGLDFLTLVIDGNDNLIALGSGLSDINHGEVYVFASDSGSEVSRNRVDFRQGYDNTFAGMVGNPAGGFLVIDTVGFEIQLNFYSPDGSLEEQSTIRDLYFAE